VVLIELGGRKDLATAAGGGFSPNGVNQVGMVKAGGEAHGDSSGVLFGARGQ